MKIFRNNSKIIGEFLVEVSKGNISAREGSKGPKILETIVLALVSILQGTTPKAALKIYGVKGRRVARHNELLAIYIHKWKVGGHYWSGIENLANEWLEKAGKNPVSLPRLKQIYRDYSDPELYDAIRNFDWRE